MNPSAELDDRYHYVPARRNRDEYRRLQEGSEREGRFSGRVYTHKTDQKKSDNLPQLFPQRADSQIEDEQHWKLALPDLRDLLHSNRLERKGSSSEEGDSYSEKRGQFSGRDYRLETDLEKNDKSAQLFVKSVAPPIGYAQNGQSDLIHANSSERKRKRSPSEDGRYTILEANNSLDLPLFKRRMVQNDTLCFAINKKLASAKDTGEIIAIYLREKDNLNHVNIATACHRLAKLHKGRLTEEIENILRQLASSAVNKKRDFKTREITNTVWSFATLGILDDALFAALSKEAMDKISDFNAQGLANTAWAFATLGILDNALFAALSKESMDKIRDFNVQEIANTAWSFAKLGILDDALFAALSKEAVNKIRNFNTQDISNTAWAFATLGILDVSLCTLLCEETVHKIRDFNAQGLANTAWAFATLGILDDALFAALSAEAVQKIRDFNGQEIANTAWSFAKLGILDDALFAALSKEAVNKIRNFNTQDISNTAWAFATLRIRNVSLFSTLAEEAVYKIGDFDAQDIASTSWSFARLGIRNESLCAALSEQAKRKMGDFKPQETVNTAWGFAILGYNEREFFNIVKNDISTIAATHDFSTQMLFQLGQVALHIKYEMNEKSFSWPSALSTLITQARRESQSTIHSSNIHKDCSHHLSLMGFKPQDEYEIEGLILDIYCPEENTLIEIDGPTHFAVGSHEPLGHTIFKQRILRAMGSTILNIPYWEWQALHDNAAKQGYLKQKLNFKQQL